MQTKIEYKYTKKENINKHIKTIDDIKNQNREYTNYIESLCLYNEKVYKYTDIEQDKINELTCILAYLKQKEYNYRIRNIKHESTIHLMYMETIIKVQLKLARV